MYLDFALNYKILDRAQLWSEANLDQFVMVELNSYEIYLSASSRTGDISVKWGKNAERVRLAKKDTAYGPQYLLVCPQSGKRCLTLYARGRILASVESHFIDMGPADRRAARAEILTWRLVGHEGRGPARGKRRRAGLAKLAALSKKTPLFYEAKVLLDNRARREERAERGWKRLSQGASVASTSLALHEGHLVPAEMSMTADWMNVFEQPGESLHLPMGPTQPVVEITSVPVLDIDAWVRRCGIKPGECKAYGLWYLETLSPGSRVHGVAVDLRKGNQPRVLVQSDQGFDTPVSHQLISLMRSRPTRPLRWFMACPITGKRSTKLYLRDGVFASREAQRLRYRSQIDQSRKRPARASPIVRPSVATVERIFELTYQDLQRSGLFAVDREEKVITFHHASWDLQAWWSSLRTTAVVEWRQNGLHSVAVHLDQRLGPEGPLPLLICPKLKIAVPALLMRDNVLASPSYHERRRPRSDKVKARAHHLFSRLKGLDGKAPTRGKNRQRFLKELARRVP